MGYNTLEMDLSVEKKESLTRASRLSAIQHLADRKIQVDTEAARKHELELADLSTPKTRKDFVSLISSDSSRNRRSRTALKPPTKKEQASWWNNDWKLSIIYILGALTAVILQYIF
eukprot:TRINITY_DN5746_c0_g1_i24.p1 TRINITY_DN5746_c0_g1~~TRINITY_DN5746_c0_g1_i24.p1  ORF type:complete len:116 (-),score=23.41 TRINITY_DN5746_c0_g1_i24:120-467(-)